MWKDAGKKQQAAAALRYTAADVQGLGCVDDVVPEPPGGAHTDPAYAMHVVNERLERHLAALKSQTVEDLLASRYLKFRSIAQFYTEPQATAVGGE